MIGIILWGELRQLLETKKHNLYAVGELMDRPEYERCLQQMRICIDELNQKLDDYNEVVRNYSKKQTTILNLNVWVGYLENKSSFEEIEKLQARIDEVSNLLVARNYELKQKGEELAQLNREKESTTLAMNYINGCKRTVFADPNRMKLEEQAGRYKLKVRGQNVASKNISVGERNILALSYFFAKIFEGSAEAKMFEKEMFIVIDDPVSKLSLKMIFLLKFLLLKMFCI